MWVVSSGTINCSECFVHAMSDMATMKMKRIINDLIAIEKPRRGHVANDTNGDTYDNTFSINSYDCERGSLTDKVLLL